MKTIDLEDYTSAWKNEAVHPGRSLNKEEILRFMKSESKGLFLYFKRSIVFDLVLKVMLLGLFLYIALHWPVGSQGILLVWLLLALTLLAVFFQGLFLHKLPRQGEDLKSMEQNLLDHTRYYNKYFVISQIINAFSATLIFLGGSLFYLLNKYGGLPPFTADDYIVAGLGLVLSTVPVIMVQLSQGSGRIRQLEACLEEIRDERFQGSSIAKYRKARLRNTIIMAIVLISGLLLFAFLLIW